MAWRMAASLEKLRAQLDAQAPRRSTLSDGGIGDAAHATTDSDHNPWVKDGSMGVVTARDFTHDPVHGADMHKFVAALVKSRDRRIKYIIWNGRIISSTVSPWAWRSYSGSNPHTKHAHVSVMSVKSLYDSTAAWSIATARYRWQLRNKSGTVLAASRSFEGEGMGRYRAFSLATAAKRLAAARNGGFSVRRVPA